MNKVTTHWESSSVMENSNCKNELCHPNTFPMPSFSTGQRFIKKKIPLLNSIAT